MKNYALIANYKAMKGFFKKKVAGEYLIVAFKDSKNDTFILLQFLGQAEGKYVVTIIAYESPDDDLLEEQLDGLRYHSQIDILEDKLPIKVDFKNKITITFTKTSKYIGKKLVLSHGSNLPDGYMFADVKMKKGYEPAQHYKIGSEALDTMKKMRAFTTSRLNAIMKRRK